MSLQRFNLVCTKAAAISHIRTGRLTRPLPIICRRTGAPATFDRRSFAGCSSGKTLLRAPADNLGGIVFRRQKSSGDRAFSPVETGASAQ